MILPPGLYSRGSALDIGLKQSFDQSAANGCSEPIVTDAAKYIYDCSWENILTNPPVGQINLEQWVLI
ncbi:MAG TPA: hypothetical protein DCM70_09475 [Rhodobacteraceae bacterium]|nr:hypothetical protein [Paracoccaceae bacterium]